MNHEGIPAHSAIERQLRRLVVPALYDVGKRIDLVHAPNLELLWQVQR